MAITYPLTIPSISHIRDTEWDPVTMVGRTQSPYTGQSQTYVWPGQWWAVRFSLIPLNDAKQSNAAGLWEAFMLSLNGQQGTFRFGDPSRKTPRGTISGSPLQVGSSAAALSTVLPITNGTGQFAVGDWLQVGNNLHRVINIIDSGHVDVWPRLRSAYAAGTTITYTNPLGLFQLRSNSMKWNTDVAKFHGITIDAVEYLS